jgi:hypothetical protein
MKKNKLIFGFLFSFIGPERRKNKYYHTGFICCTTRFFFLFISFKHANKLSSKPEMITEIKGNGGIKLDRQKVVIRPLEIKTKL